MALTSSSNAIATGLIMFGSDPYILNTTNGGANWNYASANPTTTPPLYFNALDVSGTRAVAVGTNGLISTSSNGGVSWGTTSAGTTNYLSDVKFVSYDTVFAVGQNVILKSVNGGSAWSAITTTATCQMVSCVHNVIYVGAQDGSFILKSTDYGNSYTSIPLPFNSTGVILAISKDTILSAANDGLYVSNTGGLTWEKYVLSNYQQVDMIDHYGSAIMAVGKGGFAIRTSNLPNCPTIPVASFNIQGGATSFCEGDTIQLNNTTAQFTGYSYKWLLANVPFSTQYNAKVKLPTEGNETVSLVVSNAHGSDTVSTTVYVVGHSINTMSITSTADSICSGNMVSFTVANTQNGVTYRLRKGMTNIGALQNGNGGSLSFSYSSPIPVTTTFNVIAVKTTSCFTDSIIQYKTITLYSNPVVLTSNCTPATNLCANHGITNVSLNSINHSSDIFVNNYFDYSCCQKTDLVLGTTYSMSVSTSNWEEQYVAVWIDMNNDGAFTGSEIVFSGTTTNFVLAGNFNVPASATVFNQYLRMRVESNLTQNMYNMSACGFSTDCGQIEDYAVRILNAPAKPVPSFTTVATVGCTTSMAFNNTSYNAVSDVWNFGDGSPVSTSLSPTHTYSVSGSYTVSLKACNAYGCDSIKHVVSITIPQVPKPMNCAINIQSGYSGLLGRFTFDTLLVIPAPTGTSYTDYTCTKQFRVHAGTSYPLTIESSSGFACATFGVWIDFNNDGLFNNAEQINAQANMYTACPSISGPIVIQIPTTATQNTALRMRILFYDNSSGYIYDGCNSGSVTRGGQALDYTVFVDPPLPVVAAFTANYTAACTNTNITFTNNSKNATIYAWNFGDGTTSNLQGPTHTYSVAGTYSVKLVESNGTYSDSITQTNYITVKTALATPTITLSGTTLTTTATATHYQWYKNGTAISGDTTNSINAALNTGTYVVVITNSNGCTTSSAGYLYHPIHANFTCSPTSICGPNSNYTLLTNSSINATSYAINWGDGSAVYNYNGSGGPIHTYSVSGQFTVSMIACNGAGNCDTLKRTNYITVSSGPPSTPTITLSGSQLTTTNTSTTYQWYYNSTIITGATSPTYTPTTDGTYSLAVNNPGCTAAGSSFSYNHTHVSFHANTTTVCATAPQTIGFTNTTTGATSYLWSFGDGQTATTLNPTHTYTAYGYYTVKLKACGTLNCDSVTDVSYLSIHPAVTTPTLVLTGNVLSTTAKDSTYQWNYNNVAIPGANSSSYVLPQDGFYSLKVSTNGCSITTLNLNYRPVHIAFNADTLSFCGSSATHVVNFTNSTTNGTSYVWNFGDGQTSTSTSTPLAHTYTAYGSYTVKLKACGTTNCDSVTHTNYISISPKPNTPTITLNGNQLGTSTTYSTYQWYFNNTLITGATAALYTPMQNGMYSVLAGNNLCSAMSANFSYYPVALSFSADTLSFCGSATQVVTFTNTTTNATSYVWSFGDGQTSTLKNPSHTYSGYGTYTVKLLACGATNCDSLVQSAYIAIHPAPAVPVIAPAGTLLICANTTALLSSNNVSGSTYQWTKNGVSISNAIDTSFSTGSAGIYYLTVTNSFGCTSHSANTIIKIDTSCVWPGDADNNKVVNNMDLLPIGVYFSQTGNPRATISNTWMAYPVSDWGTIENPNNTDIKHADCNGDGVINKLDTLAINQNYSLTNAAVITHSVTNGDIYFITSGNSYMPGDIVNAEVWVGKAAAVVPNFYGVAFDVFYNASLVETGSEQLVYATGWVGTPGTDAISFARIDAASNTAHGAITRINQADVNGYGKVATFHFKISNTITSPSVLHLAIAANLGDDHLGNHLFFNGINDSIYVTPGTTGITSRNPNLEITIYPNPFTSETTIYFGTQQKNTLVSVVDVLGKEVKSVNVSNANSVTLVKGDLNPGVYFVEIINENKTKLIKKIIME